MQLVLFPSHVQKLLTYVCCICETEFEIRVASRYSTGGKIMERIVRNAVGLAVALSASSLMFAVTLV